MIEIGEDEGDGYVSNMESKDEGGINGIGPDWWTNGEVVEMGLT